METKKDNITNKKMETHRISKPLAIAYIRSAIKEQKNSVNDFFEKQKEICEHFAIEKDITIVDFIEDSPKSGIDNFQNDLIERIQRIKDQTDISYIIVVSFHRLSRNHVIVKQYIDELKQLDIEVVAVTENTPKSEFLQYNIAHRE